MERMDARNKPAEVQPAVDRPRRSVRVVLDVSSEALWKVLGTVMGVWLLFHLRRTVTLLLMSLMLVATLRPWMSRAQARWGHRRAGVALVALYAAVLAALGYLLVPLLSAQAVTLAEHAPDYARQIQATLTAHHLHVDVVHQVDAFTRRMATDLPAMMTLAENVFAGVYGVLTVVVLSLYLLLDADTVGLNLLRLFPRERRLGVRRLGQELATQAGGYLRGQLIMSTLFATYATVVLLLTQVPGDLTLGVMAGIADAVPIIGIWVAAVPATLLGLSQDTWTGVVVALSYLAYHLLEVNFILPRVYKGTMGLPFSIVIIAFVAGIELMGVLGAVLALPVAAIIPTVLSFVHEWHEGSALLESNRLPD